VQCRIFSYDCNGSAAQVWAINKNDTKVQLSGTGFCLDAGSGQSDFSTSTREFFSPLIFVFTCSAPANNVGMKIWTCYDNLPAQAWYYTEDNRIAVTGQGVFSL